MAVRPQAAFDRIHIPHFARKTEVRSHLRLLFWEQLQSEHSQELGGYIDQKPENVR
jgi:hypothetical protein